MAPSVTSQSSASQTLKRGTSMLGSTLTVQIHITSDPLLPVGSAATMSLAPCITSKSHTVIRPTVTVVEVAMVMQSVTRCEWCLDGGIEDVCRPEDMCDAHAAEYDGVSEVQHDRQSEAEWLDLL